MSDLKCPFSRHSAETSRASSLVLIAALVNQAGQQAIAEIYAQNDSQGGFVGDFVDVWGKVMELDRLDRT